VTHKPTFNVDECCEYVCAYDKRFVIQPVRDAHNHRLAKYKSRDFKFTSVDIFKPGDAFSFESIGYIKGRRYQKGYAITYRDVDDPNELFENTPTYITPVQHCIQ